MQEIEGQQAGGMITTDTLVRGQLIGDSTVAGGVLLIVLGQFVGSLTVGVGGRVEIPGQVVGDVINSGQVTLTGMLVGRLIDAGGTANIAPGARVFG